MDLDLLLASFFLLESGLLELGDELKLCLDLGSMVGVDGEVLALSASMVEEESLEEVRTVLLLEPLFHLLDLD